MDEIRRTGRRILGEVLGDDYLARRDAATNAFNAPLREFSEVAAFGLIWSRPGLERKTRSLLCLAMLTALGRPHELELHLASALENGATALEIRETLLHAAAYCGIPAALDATRLAERFLEERGLLADLEE